MPALIATLTLNGTQYQGTFAAITSQTVAGNAEIAASAHASAAAQALWLEQQIVAARAAGVSTVALQQQLAIANAQYVATGASAQRAAAAVTAQAVASNSAATANTASAVSAGTSGAANYLQAKAALQAAAAAHAQAVANVRAAQAAISAAGATTLGLSANLANARSAAIQTAATLAQARATMLLAATQGVASTVSGALLVILKDLGRGQWARALSTFLTTLESIGISAASLLPIVAITAAVGYALYKMVEGAKAAAEGMEYLTDKVGMATARLNAQITSVQDLFKADMEYAKWKKKQYAELARARDVEGSPEEKLALMQEEFAWQQKIANLHRQTPQQSFQAELAEKEKEVAFLEESRRAAAMASDKARGDKEAAESGRAQNIEAVKTELAAQKDALDKAKKVIPELREAFAQKQAEYAEASKNAQPGEIYDAPSKENTTLSIESEKGKTFNLQAEEDALTTGRQNVARLEKQLATAQEHIDDVTSTSEEKDREFARLENEKNKAAARLELLKKYGPEAAASEKERHFGNLTELQKIGAFVGPSISLIDVNRGIARDVKAIREHQTHGSQRHFGGDSFHVPGF